eukprot:15431070-Alexandrium_andersonii.AAC.1
MAMYTTWRCEQCATPFALHVCARRPASASAMLPWPPLAQALARAAEAHQVSGINNAGRVEGALAPLELSLIHI